MLSVRFTPALAVAAGLLLAGCGGGDDTSSSTSGSGGGGGSGGGPFVGADHVPVLVDPHKLGVFEKPGLVTITFSSFDRTDEVQQFGDWVVTSNYFVDAMGEYGVGAAQHVAKVVLDDPIPQNDAALLDLLHARIDDGTLPSPIDVPQVFYMVYFPRHSGFNDQGALCGVFDGYHSYDGYQGKLFAYSIIGECDGMINTAAHELAEAATDPFNGFYTDGKNDDPWHWVLDDEVADLCEYYPSVKVEGWEIARLWSNEAAKANTNPCLPIPKDDPVFKSVDAVPGTIQTVARGQSTTFTLTGWSTGPIEPWKLIWDHATYYPNFKGAFKAGVKFEKTTIGNGESITLTLTVPSDAPVGALGMVGIYSDDRYAEQAYVGVVAE